MLHFCLGGAPLAAVFFGYNLLSQGSFFSTGYTTTGHQAELRAEGVGARLGSYVSILMTTMGPLLLPGWAGLALSRRVAWRTRTALLAWFGGFLAFYCFYNVYGPWWYTRFLLPAYPALILGALFFARELAERLRSRLGPERGGRVSAAALAAALALTLGAALYHVDRFNLRVTGEVDAANLASCRWADRTLPAQAMIASMQMSGAIKYYTQRMILRYDLIAPHEWEIVRRQAHDRGIELYALLAPFEIEEARRQLPGAWAQLGRVQGIELWKLLP